jgi:hypothetical protein
MEWPGPVRYDGQGQEATAVHRDFRLTRGVLVLAAVAGLVWFGISVLEPVTPRGAGAPDVPQLPSLPLDEPAQAAAPTLPTWEQELLDPEIQALWQQRRQQLDRLSRVYLAEPDSARAAALRRDMQNLIDHTLREVYELRLAHARRDGHHALARRLERVLADLPPSTTPPASPRPGG